MRKILSLNSIIQRSAILYLGLNKFTPAYFSQQSKKNPLNQKQNDYNVKDNSKQQNNSQSSNDGNSKKESSGQRNLQKRNSRKGLFDKTGRVFPLPFYLSKTLKNTNSIPLPIKRKKQSSQQTSKGSSANTASKAQVPKEQDCKVVQYLYNSSKRYKQKLLLKCKIIQACKKPNIQIYPPFSKRHLFLACILIGVFLNFLSLKHQKKQEEDSGISMQVNDSGILSLLGGIKEIQVKLDSHLLYIIFNEQRSLNIYQQILCFFGFNVSNAKSLQFSEYNFNQILSGLQKIQQNLNHSDWVKVKPYIQKYTLKDALVDTVFLGSPFIGILIIVCLFKMTNSERMMMILNGNKKSMKIKQTKNIEVRFKDVAGMQNAKKQVTQFVDFLKNSSKYVSMGAKIPKGVLLTGPPGTGKTMLAKACAGEAKTAFFYVSGSEFVQLFVGLGASRVRQLFARARQEAPSIIFIDQIDAIGKKRETSRNEQKDTTLNQLLVEMDGFSTSETVIVLAATNRKDTLDSALTRPGRFDRMVEITLPELKARQEIFMVHLSPLKVNPNKPLSQIAKRLAELTPGFSGADIANLCNEAAIIAVRKKREYIQDPDFEEASERIAAGYIKKGLVNQKTKQRVAYHQAGHAVCGWYLRGGDPLIKVTIIPRSKGALGYAQYLPKTTHIRTKSELIDQIAIMLGGTTSEEVFLSSISSGNSDDLQKVYLIARKMITQWGMGAKTYNLTINEQTHVKKESQKLHNLMDAEIIQIVNQATQRARQVIEQKREIVKQLSKELLLKETLNSEDIIKIMGKRPVFA